MAISGGAWASRNSSIREAVATKFREDRKGRLADHNEQRDPMADDRLQFIGFMANSAVMADRYPALPADGFQPLIIGRVWLEMFRMPLDLQAGCGKDIWKLLAEIAIREENAIQAARS